MSTHESKSKPDVFAVEVEHQRQKALARIGSVRVSILLWGPSGTASTPVAVTRKTLRQSLEDDGHLVQYSEELYDPASRYSLLAQQVADVESHDITFSLPESPGSIAEAHDFARIPGIANRIVMFIDEASSNGYANKTLLELESVATSRIQVYRAAELPDGVVERARSFVRRLQEHYYMTGRRS